MIDSIGNVPGTARYFCRFYSNTMNAIADQLQKMDTGTQHFVRKFETSFADLFLKAWIADNSGGLDNGSEWKFYFSHPGARPWQLIMAGANAHTNINLWEALVKNFSRSEIIIYRKNMLRLQHSIRRVYCSFYDTLCLQSRKMHLLNAVTLGITKHLGERLLYKWRKRNVGLAILYYQNPDRFRKRLEIVTNKKKNIDRKILKNTGDQ